MNQTAPSECKDISDPRVEAELLKLHLEIENLRQKNRWEGKISAYIPLFTVGIAVAGFLFGIFQFQAQQRHQQDRTISEQQKDREARQREQAARIQDRINADVERLLRFTSNNEITISEVAYILNDLKFWIDQRNPEKQVPSEPTDSVVVKHQERSITTSLAEIIMTDSDFDHLRDSDFSNIVIDKWEDYSDGVKKSFKNDDYVLFVLGKYVRALTRLRGRNPGFLETIEYDAENESFENCDACGGKEEQKFLHFLSLKNGFKKHLELLGENSKFRQSFIAAFQAAVCNATLTKQLFNQNYPGLRCY